MPCRRRMVFLGGRTAGVGRPQRSSGGRGCSCWGHTGLCPRGRTSQARAPLAAFTPVYFLNSAHNPDSEAWVPPDPHPHPARLGAGVSSRCWHEALPPPPDPGRVSRPPRAASEGPRPLSPSRGSPDVRTLLMDGALRAGPGAGAGGQTPLQASGDRRALRGPPNWGAGGPDTGCNRPSAGVAGRFWEGRTGCGLPSFHQQKVTRVWAAQRQAFGSHTGCSPVSRGSPVAPTRGTPAQGTHRTRSEPRVKAHGALSARSSWGERGVPPVTRGVRPVPATGLAGPVPGTWELREGGSGGRRGTGLPCGWGGAAGEHSSGVSGRGAFMRAAAWHRICSLTVLVSRVHQTGSPVPREHLSR